MNKELTLSKISLALRTSKGLFEDIFVTNLTPIKPTLKIINNAIKTIPLVEQRLKELEKAFDTLSKENEKTMKELSKEIEKNRALEFIKKCFYVAKSSGAVLRTDYGFEHEKELKEVLL